MMFEKRRTSFVFEEVPVKFGSRTSIADHKCRKCYVSIRHNLRVLIMWDDTDTGNVCYLAGTDSDGKFFPGVEDALDGLEGFLPRTVSDHVNVVANAYKMGLT